MKLPTGSRVHKHGIILPDDYQCEVVKVMKAGRIHVKNEDTSDGSPQIKLWTPEEHYMHMLNVIFGVKWPRNIPVKSRRAYMTTHIVIGILIEMRRTPYFKAFMVNWQKQLGSSEMMKNMIKVICENTEIFKRFDPGNERVVYEHPKGDSVFTNVKSARSAGGDFAHFSDFGKFSVESPEEAKEALAGTIEAVNKNRVVIESTSAGNFGMFAQIAMEAYERQKRIAELAAEGRNVSLSPQEEILWFFPWYEKRANEEEPMEGREMEAEILEYFEMLEKEEDVILTPRKKWWFFNKWKSSSINRSFPAMAEEHPSTVEEAFSSSDTSSHILAEDITFLRSNGKIGNFNPQWNMVTVSFDIGFSDKTAMLFWELQGNNEWTMIDSYANRNQRTEHYIQVLRDRGYNYDALIVPHDADHKRALTAQKMNPDFQEMSIKERMNMAGFGNVIVIPKLTNQESCFQDAKRFCRGIRINEPPCREALNRLREAKRATKKSAIDGTEITISELKHTDDSADWYKAFETMARHASNMAHNAPISRQAFERAATGFERGLLY